jgi:hypothetical protein
LYASRNRVLRQIEIQNFDWNMNIELSVAVWIQEGADEGNLEAAL